MMKKIREKKKTKRETPRENSKKSEKDEETSSGKKEWGEKEKFDNGWFLSS